MYNKPEGGPFVKVIVPSEECVSFMLVLTSMQGIIKTFCSLSSGGKLGACKKSISPQAATEEKCYARDSTGNANRYSF